MTPRIRRKWQPFFWPHFAISLIRLWWFNRKAHKARARRLAEG